MLLNILFFIVSFVADILAYIFYQRYVDSHHKNTAFLVYAVVTAALVWIFIFKLQDRGQILRVFVPVWAAGTAVFGYLAAGIATKTPMRELLNPLSLACITAIGLGIYFLNRA